MTLLERKPTVFDLPPAAEKASLIQLLRGSTDNFIYFLCDGDECVYVGQSTALRYRLSCHAKDKYFDSVYLLRTSKESLDAIERHWIRTLSPTLNQYLYPQKSVACPSGNVSAVKSKILLPLPPDWLAAFRAAAKRQNQPLAEWIRLACAKSLPTAERKRLSLPRKPGRQPKE